MNKGKYFAFIEIDWFKKKSHNVDSIVISSYANHKIDFCIDEIVYPDEKLALKIIDKILLLNKPFHYINHKIYEPEN